MVYPGTLFIGDSGAFLRIPMKVGVKSEHCGVRGSGTVVDLVWSESRVAQRERAPHKHQWMANTNIDASS
jgi:hypothetical protein